MMSRLRSRMAFVMAICAVLIAAVFQFAFAGVSVAYIVDITDADCESVSYTYTLDSGSSGGFDYAEVTVTVDGDVVFSDPEGGSPYDDSGTVGLSLTPRPAPYLINVTVSLPGYVTGSAAVSVACDGEVNEIATGQICFGRGSVAATVFFSGDRIDVYAISPEDKGELVMSFTQDYLSTLPALDGEALLLGDSDLYIGIEMYRNANGLYRMVAGPDAEGKTFECTFGGSCAIERSWIGDANNPKNEATCSTPVSATPEPTLSPTPEPSPTSMPL